MAAVEINQFMRERDRKIYLRRFKKCQENLKKVQAEAEDCYISAIQHFVDYYKVTLVTGQMSDIWQIETEAGRLHEWSDFDKHPLFKDLKALDEMAEDFGIGPSNMEKFEPRTK